MKDYIPEYFTLVTKGKALASTGKRIDLMESIKYFKDALEIEETDDALSNICGAAIKLNDPDLFEEYALIGAKLQIKHFYYDLGRFYGNINIRKFDIDKAIQWYEKSIEEGNVLACKDMAIIYLTGRGKIRADAGSVEKYLLKALEINNPIYNGEIHNLLGLYYRDIKQFDKAFEQYMKAAESQFKPSYINVALAYRDGLGVGKDISKYAEYLFKDVNYDSAFEIGMLYLGELYAPKDEFLAKMYLRCATSLKHPSAALMYAACLASEKDFDEKEVFAALEIAFKYGRTDDYLKLNYSIIEDSFDEKVADRIRELAKKYWDISRAQA